ncbi:auxin-induced protein 22D-like [Magnolia sinica]|uniref:auxin-induced protein 22D-like n=1 Tax=Magnolia sinica TaxID=86752 RepID=UPI002658B5DC|nr:auxin-induced protein 22D-like [Magnolia sinica]
MEIAATYETDLNFKATELRLGLPGTDSNDKRTPSAVRSNKRTLAADSAEDCLSKSGSDAGESDRDAAPVAKVQVVGWPPIRSYRKNSFQAKKTEAETGGIYVKVSMDGAPYLRKIDLKIYKGYPELLKALESMFKSFTTEREGCKGSDYAPTYEDKDGDWMLVGDVPWDMFISSCKRLRIMKGSEARGLGSGV